MASRILLVAVLLTLTVVCAKHVHHKVHHKPSLSYEDVRGSPYTVSWDERAILINGNRVLLQSGSIHYPRSTPDMWPDILARTRAAGINLIQIYIFWNYHEPVKGVYDFSGNKNVSQFLQDCADAGLFVNVRYGPYVCAEWDYGGFPMWLRDEPGMVFRTDNEPWKNEMQTFMDYVVKMTEPFLARNGGPVILAQVENEYGNVEPAYGDAGARYVQWAANLALSYQLDIPWIMCQQDNAPMTVIATCNGYYCDNWISGHIANRKQPALWTENWPGWFQNWGEPVPTRPVEDVAFAVARWIARGGTHHNYYMFHGGTTFGRHTGGPFIVTSYDYDVALNEYGLPHEPKYTHSSILHHFIQSYSPAILSQAAPVQQDLGLGLESHTYGTIGTSGSIAFLSNINTWGNAATVTYANTTYTLPLWSVTLVDGATLKVIYCTATLSAHVKSLAHEYQQRKALAYTRSHTHVSAINTWNEPIGAWDSNPVVSTTPMEQLSLTKDTSDFLWYQTTVTLTQDQINAGTVTVSLTNIQDYVEVFFNSVSLGTGRSLLLSTPFYANVSSYTPGTYPLSLAVQTVGIVNYGPWLETYKRGLLGTVSWGGQDITTSTWSHVVGLKGEKLQIWTHDGSRHVPWVPYTTTTSYQWYKLTLAPVSQAHAHGADPKVWALDMAGMGKGMVWVNGHMLGRYWSILATSMACKPCSYVGSYNNDHCRIGCGEPSQRYYHIPRAWLNPAGNVITVFEEQINVDPNTIKIVQMN